MSTARSSMNHMIAINRFLHYSLDSSIESCTLREAFLASQIKGRWIGLAPSGQGSQDSAGDQNSSDLHPIFLQTNEETRQEFLECCNEWLGSVFGPESGASSCFNSKGERFENFKNVNEMFGNEAFKQIGLSLERDPERVPTVWILDIHLVFVAATLRHLCNKSGHQLKIVYSHDSFWPTFAQLRDLPLKEQLLQGILCCDLVLLETSDCVDNFLDCCAKILGTRVNKSAGLVNHTDRAVRIATSPLPYLSETLGSDTGTENIRVIVSCSDSHGSKNPEAELLAFGELLQNHPELRGTLNFIQACCSSSICKKLQATADEINKRNSNDKESWTPVKVVSTLTEANLRDLYSKSTVGIFTNCKSTARLHINLFLDCCPSVDGAVLISPSLGGLPEAFIANRNDIGNFSDVLARAINTPQHEREVRMRAIRRRFLEQKSAHWFETVNGMIPCNNYETLTSDELTDFMEQYFRDKKSLAIFLDYDGTLSPIALKPELAILPPETKKLLEELSQNTERVYLAIISGRSIEDVKDKVQIKDITYGGKHGLSILHPDGQLFEYPLPDNNRADILTLKEKLEKEVCFDGAFVEDKETLLTYHYREVPKHLREPKVFRAKELISESKFKVATAKCALEAKPKVNWDKGRAALFLLENKFGLDWPNSVGVVFAGDDLTDEDGFSALKGLGLTFRVVSSSITDTMADVRINSTQDVAKVLQWLVKRFPKVEN